MSYDFYRIAQSPTEVNKFCNQLANAFRIGSYVSSVAGVRPSLNTRKIEATEGSTRFCVSFLDEEIIQGMPPEISKLVSEKAKDENTLWVRLVEWPPRVRVWARLDMVEKDLGRWVYFEVQTPESELRKKSGKSYEAYKRVLMAAYALGIALNSERCGELINEAESLLRGARE